MPLCTLIHFAHVIWVTESQGNRSNQNSPLKVNPDDLCLHSCKKSAVKKHLHIDLLPNSAETETQRMKYCSPWRIPCCFLYLLKACKFYNMYAQTGLLETSLKSLTISFMVAFEVVPTSKFRKNIL